jgi:hypothetical protein
VATEWINAVLEWAGKHLSWRWVFALCGATAVFLFCPPAYLIRFGLFDFRQKYFVWFVVTFVLTFFFLWTYPLGWLKDKTVQFLQWKTVLRQGKEVLRDLSPDEKALLSRFVRAKGSVLNLDITDGTVGVLSANGFIFQASKVGYMHRGFPYKIQPWVFKYLKNHPECLK